VAVVAAVAASAGKTLPQNLDSKKGSRAASLFVM